MNQGKINVSDAPITRVQEEQTPVAGFPPDVSLIEWPFSIAGWVRKDKNGKEYLSITLQKSRKLDSGEYERADIMLFRDELPKLSRLIADYYAETRAKR
jgi:hypothetical protein